MTRKREALSWRTVRIRFEAGGPPSADLDDAVRRASGIDDVGTPSASLEAARSLVHRLLPGWWVSSGICDLTGHASLGPDYNGPDRRRLLATFPLDPFDAGFHADLPPGGDTYREAMAVVAALARAMEAVRKHGAAR